MRNFTNRQAAVRSIRALDAMQQRCEELKDCWEELDQCIAWDFDCLMDKINELSSEIEETYPGRTAPAMSKGFSSIELMIAIAIIGILLAVIVPAFTEPAPVPAPVIDPPHYYELCISGLTFIEAIDDRWVHSGNYALVQLIGTDGLPVPCGSTAEVEQ